MSSLPITPAPGATSEAPTEPAKAPDDELSALLASLDQPSPATAGEPSGEAPMDPDLADLLKSLG